jgi:HSP20 family molecular chaperone IbpA
MRSFDFAPFYRSTVGFDRLFAMLDQAGGVEAGVPGYPPYDIERSARMPTASRPQSPALPKTIFRSS